MSFEIRRALLSVTDKTGLVELGRALGGRGVELVASGGTAAALQAAGLRVTAVEDVTRSPEMLDGRVKTLHPAIHAGVLADRDKPQHLADLAAHGLGPIDLVVVNFYDFAAASRAEALPIEAIDIGGPTLVRAAAKNSSGVVVLTSPEDYADFLAAWSAGRLDLAWRRRAAARAFERVAIYDRDIATRFAREFADRDAAAWPAIWRTEHVAVPLELRYGENPHQTAAVYRDEPAWGLGAMRQRAGAALSYNNLVDADAALALVQDLGPRPACVLVKHNNPCGAAVGDTAAAAFAAALACDPVSAFGGIAAFNVPVDAAAAAAIGDLFLEVLCAPAVDDAALDALAAKKKLRILEVPRFRPPAAVLRQLHGLLLVQEPDGAADEAAGFEVVTQRAPSAAQRADLAFVLAVCKHVRSNAIVVGAAGRTLGIGAGQMSRVDSCDLAVRKAANAGLDLRGAVAASDAFFPFPDGVERLAAAGVVAIVQPGGSKRDAEVVAAADRLGISMLLSHRRHFRH